MAGGVGLGRRHRRKKRGNKVSVVFDAEKRKEFLTGFRKRNLQKKEKAKEKLEEMLREERKRIKQEAKESYKKLVVTRRPIPEIESLYNDEFETEEATVKIVELSTDDLAEKNNWIGQNKIKESEDRPETESEPEAEEELPGMELTEKKSRNSIKQDRVAGNQASFTSEKAIKQHVKKEAAMLVQSSKAFRMKAKMEQIKNKKKSQRLKKNQPKAVKKKGKRKQRVEVKPKR